MRRLLPRLRDFVFIMMLAGAIATGSRMLNTDSDLGRHLTLGNYILSSHRIPTQDILSSTKTGEPRPPYEWFAQVLYAAADRLLGLDGVVLLASLLIAATFTVVFGHAVQYSGAPIISLAITAFAGVASALHWLARPHLFSFLFFAIWLLGLERLRRGQPWQLWTYPALMLLWSNTHGGFIYGFIALAAYAGGWLVDLVRQRGDLLLGRRLLLIAVASAVASVLTPDLWHNWDAVLNNRSAYVLSRTIETMPLQLSYTGSWPFLILLCLAVVLLIVSRPRLVAAHGFLLAGLALLSFLMVRNIPFFAIAAAPILSEWAADWAGQAAGWKHIEERFAEMDASFRGFLWSGLAVVLAVSLFALHDARQRTPVFAFRPDVFPVQAADWLREHPQPGSMFNDFNWGGYLLYRLWPEQRVFIDSQSDFYGEQLTRQSATVSAAESGWQAILDEYGVDWIITPRSAALASAAVASGDWRAAYQDSLALILVRR